MASQSADASLLCIYCEKPGPFSDEHVISAGLGADDDRFLLVDMVCKRCNTDVFGNLEREVLRSSPIAIARSFMQPHGRNRGKHTTAPGIQAQKKQMVSVSGYPDEVDFGPHSKPKVLPQLKMIGEKEAQSSAENIDELRAFVISLSTFFQGDQIICVRKHGPEHELRYEAVTMLRLGKTFTQAESSSLQAKPPRVCLWLERYDENDTQGVIPAATLFKNVNGGIVLKTSSATVEDALNFFACTVEQFSFDAQVTLDVVNPIISVRMTVAIGAMERVIAKIGINLLAFYLGRNYVTDSKFRGIKESILTGTPRLGSQIVENAAMKAMLDAAPQDHHVFLLSSVSQPGRRLAIVLIAKLYGVAIFMPLALDVPEPHLPLPVYFLVDYLNHEVQQRSIAEYTEYMTRVPMA